MAQQPNDRNRGFDYDLFISYSSWDLEAAEKLRQGMTRMISVATSRAVAGCGTLPLPRLDEHHGSA